MLIYGICFVEVVYDHTSKCTVGLGWDIRMMYSALIACKIKTKTIVLLFLYKNKAELVPEQSSPLLIL